MVYLLEQYYFYENDFPKQKAEMVVAQLVAQWSGGYEAKLLAPIKSVKEIARHGQLLQQSHKRQALVTELVDWIHQNSQVPDLFRLSFYKTYPWDEKDEAVLFAHETTAASWVLNVSEGQYGLQERHLKANDLPPDLFYPQDAMVCVPHKLLGIIPGEQCYSPKQWEMQRAKQERTDE